MVGSNRPWPLVAGLVTAASGVALILLAVVGHAVVAPKWAAAAIVLAALVELAMGALITRARGPGMAHVFAGVLALSLAMFVVVTGLIDSDALGPTPIALAVGLFCLLNALFRGIDVIVDRPQGALGESVDAVFTFVLGAVLLMHWREATPNFLAVICGIELISGGIALFSSVVAHAAHPHETAYDGRAERLVRVTTTRR